MVDIQLDPKLSPEERVVMSDEDASSETVSADEDCNGMGILEGEESAAIITASARADLSAQWKAADEAPPDPFYLALFRDDLGSSKDNQVEE